MRLNIFVILYTISSGKEYVLMCSVQRVHAAKKHIKYSDYIAQRDFNDLETYAQPTIMF